MNKIKCDVCGRFISYSDLHSGRAICEMKYPESELTVETYETLCKDHNVIEESRRKLMEELKNAGIDTRKEKRINT